jgi:GNAT superfamily N-acetyltransferase
VIALRPVVGEDSDLLFGVYASTRAEELAPVPWSDEQKLAFLRQQFEAQSAYWGEHYAGAEFSVIEADGVPAGRFYVARLPREIRLVDVALLPEWRGRGIGSRLIEGLFEEARRSSLPVTIHVELFNPARALYERLGFVAREEHGMYMLMEWRPELGVAPESRAPESAESAV